MKLCFEKPRPRGGYYFVPLARFATMIPTIRPSLMPSYRREVEALGDLFRIFFQAVTTLIFSEKFLVSALGVS